MEVLRTVGPTLYFGEQGMITGQTSSTANGDIVKIPGPCFNCGKLLTDDVEFQVDPGIILCTACHLERVVQFAAWLRAQKT